MRKNVQLKTASFLVDVTPDIGFNLAYRINEKIHSNIYIRGLVIDDGKTRAALVACDFLFIDHVTVSRWKKTIADLLDTSAANVLIHAVHQHDSVSAFASLASLAEKYTGMNNFPDEYFNKITVELADALKQALRSWRTVDCVAVSEERLQGLASNRRILGNDGKVKDMRWSSSREELKKEPVGLIDPLLRTVAFLDKEDKVLAALHFYATHPQSVVRGQVTSDVPGAALKYVSEHSCPDTHHIYFTGCGANITFGKYNLADEKKNPPDERVVRLGEQLGKGIIANLNRLEKKPIGKLEISHDCFEMPLAGFILRASNKSLEKKILRKIENTPENEKNPMAAIWPYGIYLELKRNWVKLCKPRLSLLRIGNDVNILSMPSETVVEYQLYAQSLIPEKFLACAAYNDGTYMYIPTAAMYREKGYEPNASVTTPAIEKAYKGAIKNILQRLETGN